MEEILEVISDPGQFAGIFTGVLMQIVNAITGGGVGSAEGIKSMIEGIMSPIYGIIDSIDGKVEEIFGNVDPIRSSLENYFTTRGKRPQNGDMIYTDELGICYTIFKETSDDDGIYPTPNLIFRVPFMIGKSAEGDGGTVFFAMTTFPFPDIAECVKTILKALVDFISNLIGAAFEGLAQAILDTVGEALSALFEKLYEIIEEILKMIDQIWAILNGLVNAFNGLMAELAQLQTELENLAKDLADSLTGIREDLEDVLREMREWDKLWQNLSDRIDELKEILDAAEEASVIFANGHEGIIKVLTSSVGADLRKDITWIDSDNGMGHRAKTFLWDEFYPNIKDVDWRPLEYIGADGKSYKTHFLIQLKEMESATTPTGKIEPLEVLICNDGEPEKKWLLEKKDQQ